MPAYEGGEFQSPAQIARVVVRGPAGQTLSRVPMLIDSGADVSVVPRRTADQVGAAIQPSSVLLRMYDGTETACEVAEPSLELLCYRFTGAFVVLDSDFGVLGRNILNRLVVTLDGPRQTWSA